MQKDIKNSTHNTKKQDAHFLNSVLRRKFLSSASSSDATFCIQLDTAGYWKLCTLASLKIYFFFYKVCPELHSRNTIHSQLRHRMILWRKFSLKVYTRPVQARGPLWSDILKPDNCCTSLCLKKRANFGIKKKLRLFLLSLWCINKWLSHCRLVSPEFNNQRVKTMPFVSHSISSWYRGVAGHVNVSVESSMNWNVDRKPSAYMRKTDYKERWTSPLTL